jgi:hypothetical protein
MVENVYWEKRIPVIVLEQCLLVNYVKSLRQIIIVIQQAFVLMTAHVIRINVYVRLATQENDVK